MDLLTTTLASSCGLPQLRRSEKLALVDYVENFIRHRKPKMSNYIEEDLVTQIIDPGKPAEQIKNVLDKVISFDLTFSKTPYIYQLEVTYSENKYHHLNELLKVLCNRRGVVLPMRGERTRGNYRFSILIDVAKGGNVTDGITRVAKLAYYLNTI